MAQPTDSIDQAQAQAEEVQVEEVEVAAEDSGTGPAQTILVNDSPTPPTFAESLQRVVSGFTQSLARINTSNSNVNEAESSLVNIERSREDAMRTKADAVASKARNINVGKESRDEVVRVLQEWDPV